MASFKVLRNFRIPVNAPLKFLSPGAFYAEGDTVSGLTAAESGELLLLAPSGTFEPVDEEATTINAWAQAKQVNVGGTLGASGDTATTKQSGDES